MEGQALAFPSAGAGGTVQLLSHTPSAYTWQATTPGEALFVLSENYYPGWRASVAGNETPSDGYSLVSAYVSRHFSLGHTQLEVFLRGSNLTNAEARPHTSFVKDLAPLAGRAAVAGVRLAF